MLVINLPIYKIIERISSKRRTGNKILVIEQLHNGNIKFNKLFSFYSAYKNDAILAFCWSNKMYTGLHW